MEGGTPIQKPVYSPDTLTAIAETEEILANPSKHKSYATAEEMLKDILTEKAD